MIGAARPKPKGTPEGSIAVEPPEQAPPPLAGPAERPPWSQGVILDPRTFARAAWQPQAVSDLWVARASARELCRDVVPEPQRGRAER